jgi:hypothetical protein
LEDFEGREVRGGPEEESQAGGIEEHENGIEDRGHEKE